MPYFEKPIRRSALIGPWGVGAIAPFPNDESLMIAGLDMWRYRDKAPFIITDKRLTRRLGVDELRWPPDYRDDTDNRNLKIPAVRFPRWQYCPFCGTMKKASFYCAPLRCNGETQWPNGRNCDPNARRRHRLIPERFVVVCPDGHIDDFPIIEWVHDDDHPYNEATCVLRRSTGGVSAALSGITYTCSCGAKRSMAAAMTPGALEKIGYSCKGAKPWLGIDNDRENPCTCEGKDIRVLQRGASNVWFADTRSSIYIPPEQNLLAEVADEILPFVRSRRGADGRVEHVIIDFLAQQHSVDADELYEAVERRLNLTEAAIAQVRPDMTEDEYRMAEYAVLTRSSGNDESEFYSVNISSENYHERVSPLFKSISLVHKLRETRAFVGFSRLEPNTSAQVRDAMARLRKGKENWLPAIEVFGEGIFFEFHPDALTQWVQRPEVRDRVASLSESYKKSFFGRNETGQLRPEFVLIHTFAHLLINQLSYECGYGSSSLRERIYCEKTSNDCQMYGVLIYTASGDSEGSLGGLVRQGKPGRLEDTILAAIHNAQWCSADPICIQSTGQGPESSNLAACHNCALLPETCCECGNRLLDRGVIIGTLEAPDMGYFSTIKQGH